MRGRWIFLATLLIFLNSSFAAEIKTQTVGDKQQMYLAGQFVVKYKNEGFSKNINQNALNSTLSKFNVLKSERVFSEVKNEPAAQKLNLNNVFLMETAAGEDIMQIVSELNKDPNVEYAEPVYINQMDAVPNDPRYSEQFHLAQVQAPAAWDIQYGSSDVIIGIIDSGVDWEHEDLKDVIWTNSAEIDSNGIDDDNNGYIDDVRGWDFVTGVSGDGATNAAPGEDGEEPDNNPTDFNGHGTHVAGIAAAHTNNGIGIASVSSGANIMPLRCGWRANDGNGYVSSVFAASAYMYAADNGASVTNQSSGNSGQLIVDGAYYAFLNGVLIVESAGNGDDVTPSVLGSQSWVISVGSVRSDDVKAYYSSFGEYVTVSAPGGDALEGKTILSTYIGGNQYAQLQGTSMAAPLVASVAGLVKSYDPEINVVDLFERVVQTADNIDGINPDYAGKLGSGRVNVYRALTEEISAKPNFVVRSSEVLDEAANNNGQLDPGETIMLTINLRNNWQDAQNVVVDLSVSESWPLTIDNGTEAVGNVGGVLDTNTWEVSPSFMITCAENAYPTSVKLTLTITGDGFSQVEDYYVSISPKVLLVSDFDGTNNEFLDFSSFYIKALGQNGIAFDHVYHSQTIVDAALLNQYKIVIWAIEWSFPSLEKADQDAISEYLDNGGALFLSGQDIAWQLNADDDFSTTGIPFSKNYLKIDYILDDAETNSAFGVADDPIANKIDFDFYQTKRAVANQYPDAVEPRDGAVAIFEYENQDGAAIRYNGDYRLVFFTFGGFEAISDEGIRSTLMNRIIDYLDGVEINHQRIRDREETAGNYTVTVNFSLDTGVVDSVKLYWDTDGSFPFKIVNMTSIADGKYSAEIPAQETGTTVQYFMYVQTSDDKYSISPQYSFSIGPDTQKPDIELASEPYWNTVNAFGAYPFNFEVKMDDNLGVDTTTAKINYWVGDNPPQTNDLFHVKDNIFAGSFEFEEAVDLGTEVKFNFSITDASVAKNSALSDTFSYVVDSTQLLDDFENNAERWDIGDGWGITTTTAKNGVSSITDSPFGDYQDNASNPLTFKVPFNLSNYMFAEFSYWIKSTVENNVDSLLAEASNDDGENWTTISFFARTGFSWRNLTGDLTNFTGPGNEEVLIRFRFKSDTANVLDGVYIDDPMIRVSTEAVSAIENITSDIPLTFNLKQNYPNPFNPNTTFEFNIARQSQVTLTIYNSIGQQVAQLLSNADHGPGKYRVTWDAKNQFGGNLATGVYIYKLKAVTKTGEVRSFTKKMLLLK